MAFDELLNKNFGIVTGYLNATFIRWTAAANAARLPGFTSDKLFKVMRAQFVDNWDTWNHLMEGYSTVPTVTFNLAATDVAPKTKSTIVKQRLTGVIFDQTALEQFNGTNVITPAQYAVGVTGLFDGELSVTLNYIPSGTGTAGEYRGLVLGSKPSVYAYQPIAWVVVNLT